MLNKVHKVLLGLKGFGIEKVDLIQNNLAIQYFLKIQEVWKLHKVIKIQEERFMRSEISTNIPINYLNNYISRSWLPCKGALSLKWMFRSKSNPYKYLTIKLLKHLSGNWLLSNSLPLGNFSIVGSPKESVSPKKNGCPYICQHLSLSNSIFFLHFRLICLRTLLPGSERI